MTRQQILDYLDDHDEATGADLCRHLGISRQAVNQHIKRLILDRRVEKQGATRGAVYRRADPNRPAAAAVSVQKTIILPGLEEDAVFAELSLRLNLQRRLGKLARNIARYAFTEILNNAIDHSQSSRCELGAEVDRYAYRFRIRDFGLGIFQSIASKFELQDESAAVGELLKGKTTTMAERHSGEGIFFTSKSADRISFRSHRTTLVFDNRKQDVFIEHTRFLRGTDVHFAISRRSRRDLTQIFAQYAPEEFDYRFERTRVRVRVLLDDCVSRSQAKRLLTRLTNFREVVLDFSGVANMGQAFADEVFRVFLKTHPQIALRIENLPAALAPMVRHVVDDKTTDRLTIG